MSAIWVERYHPGEPGPADREPGRWWRSSRIGALTTSTVLAGVTLFAPAAAVPNQPVAPVEQVHYDIALTGAADAFAAAGTSAWNGFWKFMLDWVFWIGQKTLPELVTNPWTGSSASIGEILSWFDVSTDDQLVTVFQQLGLQNYTLGGLMAQFGLPDTTTVDEAMQQFGLADITLEQLTHGVGIGASTTIVNLVDKLGLGSETLSEVLGHVGVPPSDTLGNMFSSLGLAGLQGFFPLFGLQHTNSVTDALDSMGLSIDRTLDQFLSNGGLGDFIGNLTVGKVLGFTDQTTLQDVVDSLNYHVGSSTIALGDVSLDQLLNQLHLNPDASLDQVLAGLPLNPEGTELLGDQTVAQALDWLLNAGQTAVPPPGVVDGTQIGDYLIGIGMGTLTLDQWLGLDPVA